MQHYLYIYDTIHTRYYSYIHVIFINVAIHIHAWHYSYICDTIHTRHYLYICVYIYMWSYSYMFIRIYTFHTCVCTSIVQYPGSQRFHHLSSIVLHVSFNFPIPKHQNILTPDSFFISQDFELVTSAINYICQTTGPKSFGVFSLHYLFDQL